VLLTRRELFEIAAMAALAPPAGGLDTRAADIIRAYSAEGHHRTATAVDRRSADALLVRARETGAAPSLQAFELSRVDPVAAFVQIGDRRIDGLPMFDGAFTSADGITGRIGPIDGDQPIALVRIAPNGEAALRTRRQESRHAAMVVATIGGNPGLCPVNAAWFTEPFGPPVLQVSSGALATLEAASASGAAAHVVAQVSRQPAEAVNVVADVRGSDPSLAPVCVMTPRSGWHANASERGGGLVCWLETMRAVVAARPQRTVKFIASSGHELGHLGLHDYLHRNPTLAHDAFAWVHFGANIGSSTGDVGMTASDDRMRDAALTALAPHRLDTIRQSQAAQVAGEAATIREGGGRFVSFIGVNAWFHNPNDLWPDAVDIAVVARYARATADLTLQLARLR
jgi:hypothetical protein